MFYGQYTNSDTGLIYLRARIYDPATAQFLTVDPLVVGTRAPYNYVGDNPANYGDRSGLEGESIGEGRCPPEICFSFPNSKETEHAAEAAKELGHEIGQAASEVGSEIESGAESIWSTIKGGGGNPQGGHRKGNLPGKGEPGSTGVTEKGNGAGTIREYGPEGWAETDFDFGHDHPPGCPGDPHAHDFEINPETGVNERGDGRPIEPGE